MNELLLCQNTNIKHVGFDDDEDKISGPHLINSDSIKLLKSKYLLNVCYNINFKKSLLIIIYKLFVRQKRKCNHL